MAEREISINNMNPDLKTPEQMQEYEENKALFDSQYRWDMDALVPPSMLSKIAGTFEQHWDIEKSIIGAVEGLNLTKAEKQELSDSILYYLDPEHTSDYIIDELKSEEGLEVVEGMELGYIGALTEYDNTLDLNTLADTIKIWDTLRIEQWGLTINWEKVGTVQSGFEGEAGRESKDFKENPYFPILNSHLGKEVSQNQLDSIEEEFISSSNILASVTQVLGENHEVTWAITDFINPTNIEERKENMFEDFPDSRESEGDLVTRLLWENYLRITDKEWNSDSEKSLLVSFQVSANKIIEGKRTFKRTKEFDDAYRRIQQGDGNSKTLSHDLAFIHSTVNRSEGIKAGKSKNRYEKGSLSAKQKTLFLEAQFEEIQNFIKTSNENNRKVQDTQQKKVAEALAQEQAELEGVWEVFAWSKVTEIWWIENTENTK